MGVSATWPNSAKPIAVLAAAMLVIICAWDTWAVYPLKILVVFFHELSHGMMAYATGGSVEEIQLDSAQGGFCITRGGSPFFILMAGYLGSLAWGSLVLMLASQTRSAKYATAALGIMILVVGLLFVRPIIGFGFLFAGVAGAAMLLAATYLTPWVNAMLLRVIGLTSCMYVILDIKSDTLDRSHIESDARMLAELTGIPTVVWGGLWLLVAIVTVYAMLRIAVRPSRPTA